MGLNSFLSLVEIRTKVASMIPFIFATLYTIYRFNKFNTKNFILMFVTLLAFDMATTAINNYMDFRRAKKTRGYNYETHNAIVRYNLSNTTVLAVIISLITFASVCGFILFLNTNIIVLLIGMLSFMVGILYSFGPIPISRTPLGEIFSGFFMGFIIVFISVYIHMYSQNLVWIFYENGVISLSINIIEIFYTILISIPLIMGIANIMLANNICDIEDDIENNRYTLPIYIGRKYALLLYKFMNYSAYLSIILAVILGVLPAISLLTLLTFFKVNNNIKIFYNKQTKKDTFITAVQNFVLINTVQIISIGAMDIINKLLK